MMGFSLIGFPLCISVSHTSSPLSNSDWWTSDLIGTVTVRRSRACCDGTAAVTWGKEYIQGQSTYSGASLLAVDRCENCIRRIWLWGRFSPRILGLALLGTRCMTPCQK